MKSYRNSLVLLQLLLFVASFLLLSYQALASSEKNPSGIIGSLKLSPKNKVSTDLLSQQISEETETETENNASDPIQISGPSNFIFAQSQSFHWNLSVFNSSLPLLRTQPIYLGVCNFRI